MRPARWSLCVRVGLLLSLAASAVFAQMLEIRDGYFWDTLKGDYFIPRGFAYQTCNPAVGADQTPGQIDYDFAEMKKIHCNSVRCEMVWSEVETSPGRFDWTKPDMLVAKASKYDLKLFVLIGFQYAPQWFPRDPGGDSWVAIDQRGNNSVMVNYEHPEARRAYTNYLYRVTSRYRESRVIGGWILGNEYAYFDLWNTNHFNLGYDHFSLASFRQFLSELYQDDIDALNHNWDAEYPAFEAIPMPKDYPRSKTHAYAFDRFSPRYHDLLLWRERSIGDYVALGSLAAQQADPHHLRSYSMVGGLFIGADENYTCEDAKTVVARCKLAGAPLDFWAINNYAWASLSGELRTGDFGISKQSVQSGLPVLVSETGHSSTENLLPRAAERQGLALTGQIWEALISGAIGAHVFTWNERESFNDTTFIREWGFGVLKENRIPKSPVYTNIVHMFRRMQELPIERLIGGSRNPPPNLYFVWPDAAKMGWPRANQEDAMLWGTLRRLGYQPWILNDEDFAARRYTNGAALVLSRCYKMVPTQLEQIRADVAQLGLGLHANTDLPGQVDTYDRPNPNWVAAMDELFGIDVSQARVGYDLGVVDFVQYADLRCQAANSGLGGLTNGYVDTVATWKIWQDISATEGRVVATHNGFPNRQTDPPIPALVIHTNDQARAAINTFALADLGYDAHRVPPTYNWDFRRQWVRAIYRDALRIAPLIEIQGDPGAQYVIPDYRICSNGSILVSLLNGVTTPTDISVRAPELLTDKVVEDLTRGGLLESNADGAVWLSLEGDEYVLLYIYDRQPTGDASLVNTSPNKIWFLSAPSVVWPRDSAYSVELGHETVESLFLLLSLDRLSWPPEVGAETMAARLPVGQGTSTLDLWVRTADYNQLPYRSSVEGAAYQLRGRLVSGAVTIAEVTVPVRLAWGVFPLEPLPATVRGGERIRTSLKWEDLPSYEPWAAGLPLDRAAHWETYREAEQHYAVTLECQDLQGNLLTIGHHLTRKSYGNAQLNLQVPEGVSGPVQWLAYQRPLPAVSHDYYDNFESRGPGEEAAVPDILRPYDFIFGYADQGGAPVEYLNHGIVMGEAPFLIFGKQYGFLVFRNPLDVGAWSGFGLGHTLTPPGLSLPSDPREWSNYVFSAKVRLGDERSKPLPGIVELQLNDIYALNLGTAYGGQIQFTQDYVAGEEGWMEVSAALDQFEVTPHKGFFAPGALSALVVNFQMLDKGQEYIAHIDDIRLDGPELPPPVWISHDIFDSFEDRLPGNRESSPTALLPWVCNSYPEEWYVLDAGVQTRAQLNPAPGYNSVTNLLTAQPESATDGLQSAFIVATNSAAGDGISGFYLLSGWPESWSLPADPSQWSDYVFSYDFREANRRSCCLEMQLKSGDFSWIQYTNQYTPDAHGWHHVEAPLSLFHTPRGIEPLDPTSVKALVVNVRMQETETLYLAAIDNIRFDGPEKPLPPETALAVYRSAEILEDSDGDRLTDDQEKLTGTDWLDPDSDDDGIADGDEVLMRTDPLDALSVFQITGVRWVAESQVTITWPSLADWVYTLETAAGMSSDAVTFLPVADLTRIPAHKDGSLTVTNQLSSSTPHHYYRVAAAPRL